MCVWVYTNVHMYFVKCYVSSLLHMALLCALIQLNTHGILDMHHISKSQVYVTEFMKTRHIFGNLDFASVSFI